MKLKARHKAQFLKLVAELNALREEVETYVPKANYYLANDTLHFMSGESHEGYENRARQDRSMAFATLKHSGGGDW